MATQTTGEWIKTYYKSEIKVKLPKKITHINRGRWEKRTGE